MTNSDPYGSEFPTVGQPAVGGYPAATAGPGGYAAVPPVPTAYPAAPGGYGNPDSYPAGSSPAHSPAYPQSYPAASHVPAASDAGANRLEPDAGEPRSLGDLVGEITKDLSTLVQQEVLLAKAEATQSAKRAGKGAGMFGGAGFAGYFVVLFLSISLWWALGNGIGHGWSALVVAVLWGIVAAVLAASGKKEFAKVRGLDRTADTLGKIPNAVKGNEEANR